MFNVYCLTYNTFQNAFPYNKSTSNAFRNTNSLVFVVRELCFCDFVAVGRERIMERNFIGWQELHEIWAQWPRIPQINAQGFAPGFALGFAPLWPKSPPMIRSWYSKSPTAWFTAAGSFWDRLDTVSFFGIQKDRCECPCYPNHRSAVIPGAGRSLFRQEP